MDFQLRVASLKQLKEDEEKIKNLRADVDHLSKRLHQLRVTQKEFRASTTFGKFVAELEALSKDISSVLKKSQEHVAATFTPMEELKHISEEEEEKEEEIEFPEEPVKISPTETALSARLLSLVLVLHALELADKMSEGDAEDKSRYRNNLRELFESASFIESISKKALTTQRAEVKDVFDFANRLYDFVLDGDVDINIIEEGIEIPKESVLNEEELRTFFQVYLSFAIEKLPSDTSDVYLETLPRIFRIADRPGENVYERNTTTEEREMVDRVVREISEEVAREMRPEPTIRRTREKREGIIQSVKTFVFGEQEEEKEEEEEEMPETEEEEEEEEVEEEVTGVVPGVDNVVPASEGELFDKLYSYPTTRQDWTEAKRDSWDEDDLPIAERYRAQTYAVNLLRSVDEVDAFVEAQKVTMLELFTMIRYLSVNFLAQKYEPELVKIGTKEERRYEIDIDIRQPIIVKGEGFRGMTDLDADILKETYMSYVLTIRSVLEWYLEKLEEGRSVITEEEKKLMDNFLQSQYRFPLPLSNIHGISREDTKKLQDRAVERSANGEDFTPSDIIAPKIDTAVNTDLSAAIRFRMYTDARKQKEEAPINLVRLINLIQSGSRDVYSPLSYARSVIQDSMGLSLNPTNLSQNWYTNLLIRIAKKMLPGATIQTVTGVRENRKFYSLHLFASQEVLPTEAGPRNVKRYPLYNPVVLPGKVTQDVIGAYEAELRRTNERLLPSRCDACRRKKAEAKKDKQDWEMLECQLSKAIVEQDNLALVAALKSAQCHLQAEREKGATKEHLKEHIEMLQLKMKTAGQLGLAGESIMEAIRAVNDAMKAMPSGCPSHRKRY